MTSHDGALEIIRCESIRITLRAIILLWAGALTRRRGRRLPKRIVFGNLKGSGRRGRGGKEKEWTSCSQSDIRVFRIYSGDRKTTTLEAEVWVETVMEGMRRFMGAWRKCEVDAARHRQEKREATKPGKMLSHTEA